jgi:hypothetical protein
MFIAMVETPIDVFKAGLKIKGQSCILGEYSFQGPLAALLLVMKI